MAEICVVRSGESSFRVELAEGSRKTVYRVAASPEQVQHYGAGSDAERLIEASFEFLLEREPAGSILRSFELPVIERYFPEYPAEIRKRLG